VMACRSLVRVCDFPWQIRTLAVRCRCRDSVDVVIGSTQ
jgi:hypothetical protein